VKFCQFSKY